MGDGPFRLFNQQNPRILKRILGVPFIQIYPETLAIKRGDFVLKNVLDTNLTELANNGTLKAIAGKYDVTPVPPAPLYDPNVLVKR